MRNEGMEKCPKCGGLVSPIKKICISCGELISDNKEEGKEKQESEVQEITEAIFGKKIEQTDGLACQLCGNTIKIRDEYCKNCGAQLGKGSGKSHLERDEQGINMPKQSRSSPLDNADGWYFRGMALLNAFKPKEARECIKRALEIDSQHEPALAALKRFKETDEEMKEFDIIMNRAYDHEGRGELDKAIEQYDLMLKDNPNDIIALTYKGRALQELKRNEEALGVFNHALELKEILRNRTQLMIPLWLGKAAVLSELGQTKGAMELFDKVLEINPFEFNSLFFMGVILLRLGRAREALPYILRSTQSAPPNDSRPFFSLGVIYMTQIKDKEAIDAFTEVLKRDSKNFEAICNMGICHKNLKEYKQASDCFEKALQIEPNNQELLKEKRMALRLIGMPAEEDAKKALAYFDQAIELHKNDRVKKALKLYDKSIELYPNFAESWLEKGAALMHLKRVHEARKCFDKALEIDALLTDAWVKKGFSSQILNKYDEAIKFYKKALEVEPNHIMALQAMGSIYIQMENFKEALLIFSKVIELDPNQEVAWIQKGLAHESLGQYKEAHESYMECVKRDPNSEFAQMYKERIKDSGPINQAGEPCVNKIDGKDFKGWMKEGVTF